MKITIRILFFLLILGAIVTIFFFKNWFQSKEDFYNQAVKEVSKESYYGVVIKKFYDKYNHGREKIIIVNNGLEEEVDLIYEKSSTYKFIKVGDTLVKEKSLLQLQIKRKNLDTIIPLKFENVKGYEKYSNGTE